MIGGAGGTPANMTESSIGQQGVPPEEGIEDADARGDLGTDPEAVPNAPNRDPAVPPDPADVGAGDDPDVPSGFASIDDQAEHRGGWGTQGPNPPH